MPFDYDFFDKFLLESFPTTLVLKKIKYHNAIIKAYFTKAMQCSQE